MIAALGVAGFRLGEAVEAVTERALPPAFDILAMLVSEPGASRRARTVWVSLPVTIKPSGGPGCEDTGVETKITAWRRLFEYGTCRVRS